MVFEKLLGLPKISRCVTYLLLMNSPGTTVQVFMCGSWIGTILQDFSSRIEACLEVSDVTICTMKLSHRTAKVFKTASDLIHFQNKSNALGNRWTWPIYGKSCCHLGNPHAAHWPLLLLPEEAPGATCPSCSPTGGPDCFPFLLFLGVRLLCSETHDCNRTQVPIDYYNIY